jgi:2-polyprenyl-3-methyl-5-hydroxy-6-metoxy-1,4-benzoquinol methylase
MPSCPHCGEPSRISVKVYGDELFRCRSCGLIFQFPYPTKDKMVERHQTPEYADHPYFRAGEMIGAQDILPLHKVVVSRLESYLAPGDRVLDVGAGTGDLLLMIAGKFKVTAIEPSPHLAEQVRSKIGCSVFEGAFEDYPATDPFGAILLIDVIEHTADPRQLLARAFSALRKDGLLFISTVDSSSLLYRLGPLIWRASRWMGQADYALRRIFCYQHNWYFNRRVLARVVDQAGFDILEHEGFEFPVARLLENRIMMLGLRTIFLIQKMAASKSEQYLVARKKCRA